jgi:hypothetical protein
MVGSFIFELEFVLLTIPYVFISNAEAGESALVKDNVVVID